MQIKLGYAIMWGYSICNLEIMLTHDVQRIPKNKRHSFLIDAGDNFSWIESISKNDPLKIYSLPNVAIPKRL